jgi:hypothetical protein
VKPPAVFFIAPDFDPAQFHECFAADLPAMGRLLLVASLQEHPLGYSYP